MISRGFTSRASLSSLAASFRGSHGTWRPCFGAANRIPQAQWCNPRVRFLAEVPRKPVSSNIGAATWRRSASAWPKGFGAGKNAGHCGGGANVRRYSIIPRSRFFGEHSTVYVLCGLNVLGTLVWIADEFTGNRYRSMLQDYLCVWGYRGRIGNNILAFVASNFSNMNVISGIFTSIIVYTVGLQATAHGGPGFLLATHLLGGTFSQLCQVYGPVIAERLHLPAVLQVNGRFATDGASGACFSLLAWYCFTYPTSQLMLFMVVPVPITVFGGLFLGGIAYTIFTDGHTLPLLGGPPSELWRTMGGIAAGATCALVLARRPGMMRRRFF